MRLPVSDIIFGTTLILFILHFALSAPLLERQKRHAYVDVVHLPKDMMTVLGKRGDEDLGKIAKLTKEFFESSEKPVESSDAHASSSSAQPASDHASTVDAKAPEPNPGSPPPGFEHGPTTGMKAPEPNPGSPPPGFEHGPTADVKAPELNPGPPPAKPYPTTSSGTAYLMPGVQKDELSESDHSWLYDSDNASPTPSDFGSDHELTGEHASQSKPNPGPSKGVGLDIVQEYWKNMENKSPPKPNPGPSAGADPDFDWEYWENLVNQPARKRPASPKEVGQASERQVKYTQQPNLGLSADMHMDLFSKYPTKVRTKVEKLPPLKRPKLAPSAELGPSASADPNFDWEYWTNLPSPPRKRPALPKEVDQASKSQVEHTKMPNLGPSAGFDSDFPRKRPKLALSKESGLAHDGQVVDLQQSNPALSRGSVLDMSHWHKTNNMFDVDHLLHQLKDSPPSQEPNPLATAARPLNPGTSSPVAGPTISRLPASPGSPEEVDYELVRGPPEEFNYELVNGPPTSPELTDHELHSDHQSSSTDSQQVDLLAAIYGAKGKAKKP